MSSSQHPLGIDVGGSGIKGAPVDLEKGAFATERLRLETPKDSTPTAVVEVIDEIARKFSRQSGKHPIGVTVPAVVSNGIVRTAANIDDSWIGTDADGLFSEHLGREVHVLNDADAAGLAEAHYGAARGTRGLVLVTTLGTGIGTALISDGRLVANSELGHIEIGGVDAETVTANSAREREDLSWQEWADRLQTYYSTLENLLWPDLIVVGGGVSKKAEKFLPLLHLRAPIVAAQLKNDAGIIGAAHAAVHAGGHG
ncbi:polyphosphate--glucose phosphotransferase [Kytococcus sedentarius]|uniref:polyphosphate--glucose phosphotransferase n=1 Tax=Kytococcus sedentarius TaxID=1276 RepID=UPI001950F1DB|nr:ROK family protein [Kytococcus sedentarius]QRO88233.1 ROK family protein [Kytococcus sedentarius]